MSLTLPLILSVTGKPGTCQDVVVRRPKSLYIWDHRGGIGKTEWARSLGRHSYLCGDVSIRDSWDSKAKYCVLDDTTVDTVKKAGMWKGLMSGQKVMCLRDLYHKKTTKFGLPTIMCSNERPDSFNDWDYEHIVVVELKKPLFVITEE